MSRPSGLRRLRRLAAGAAVGMLSVGVLAAAPSAFAQGDAGPERDLVVREVDATAYPAMKLVVTTPGATSLDVTQNGAPVSGLRSSGLEEAGLSALTVLVVDTSKAMATQDVMDHVVLGLKQVVLGKGASERMALVTFGVSGRVSVQPTTDAQALLAGIDRLEPSTREEASRNEGLREALDLVEEAGADVADLVVVAASRDGSSTVSDSSVIGGILGAHVVAHAVGIDLGDLDPSALQRVARAAPSGSYVQAGTPSEVVPALQATRASLDAIAALTYTGPADAKVLDISVRGAGQTATALVNAGNLSAGADLNPGSVDGTLGKGPAILRSSSAKFMVLGLALVTFVLLAYGVFLIAVRDDTDLESVLSHYDDRPILVDDGDEDTGSMVQSKLLRSAVALTSRLAEQQGVLSKVERMLERADLPLRPAEALFVYLAVVAVAGVLGLVLTGSLLLALAAMGAAALIPPAVVNMKAAKRRSNFQAQLPDMLNLLAGSLRAGYSLMQGVEAVSREVQDPMGAELRRVVIEARLGRPLDEALDDASKRMNSPDFAWTVMAIGIQREVGGNLAELLLTVSDTMVQRERLRRDVKSLTAEGRVSAVVLAILPPALMGAMYAVNPNYISTLFTERIGNYLLIGSTLLALAGFAWMKKLGKVEV